MSEQLELYQYNHSMKNDSDTEYQEIRRDDFLEETLLTAETSTKLLGQYNFFTQFEVKSFQKTSKKKRSKKKDSSNLIDLINSELALSKAPLVENVITKVDYSKEQISYLVKTTGLETEFKRSKSFNVDAENAWRYKATDLSPVFPRVLENALCKDKHISVQYVESVLFDDIITEYQEYEKRQPSKFLKICLRDIIFINHHDFSLEKLLCIKLVDFYKEYCNIQNEIKSTIKHIEINKNTRNNLKQQFLNIGSTTKEDLRFDQTVLKYTGKFLRFKDKYYQLLNTEKECHHIIVSLWSDIEMIRQKFGITNTPFVLEFTRIDLDDDDYEKQLTAVFEIELSDMIDRVEYEYVTKYLEYKNIKESNEAGEGVNIKALKPKLHIDQNKLKDEVENIVNKIVLKHKTNIFLKENKYSERTLSNNRKIIYKYNFKIYVDNVLVCESESSTSSFCFNRIEFFDTLSIQILPNNEILTIFLCEDEVKVASIIIKLCDVSINSSNAKFHTEFFKYKNLIQPTVQFIGCGFEIKDVAAKAKVRLKSGNMFKEKLYTTAKVDIKVGWSDQLNDNECLSIKESMSLGRQLKRLIHGNDKPNVSILTDIIEKVYDRNINNDTTIKNALQDACKTFVNDDSTFITDHNSPEMVRLKLLHLRNYGGFDDVVDKAIPIFPRQISTEQLSCLLKSEENEFDLDSLQKDAEIDPVDVQRFMSVKYVEKLNGKLQKRLSDHLLKKSYKDVVRDFKDLSLRGIFSNQSNFELEAISSVTKQRLLTECLMKDQEVIIVVLRAYNLLDRRTAIISEEHEDNDSIAGFKVRPLRPFVRINYHGVSVQTSTAIGCHPTWNSTMKIKTKLSPLSSLHVNVYDECKVDISDAYSKEQHSSLNKAVHYKLYNKWLGTVQIPLHTVLSLGSIQGAFKINSPPVIFGYDAMESNEPKSVVSEVSQLMKKELSFLTLHISTNLRHLGGFQGYTQPVANSDNDLLIKHLNTFVTEFLNEFPTRNLSLTSIDSYGRNRCLTEFLQPVPLPGYEWFPKNPKTTDSAKSKSSSSKSSRRKQMMVSDREYEGSDVRASENLSNVSEMKSDQILNLVDAAVRYVALIPTYEITETHVVTLSGPELLKVLYGSPLDHTILLASYFLHLGIRCWIVTGLALPRGLSSYVLVKYEQRHRVVMVNDSQKSKGFLARGNSKQCTWFLYDAVSGERFEFRDASCPMKIVDYVFDADNIWVNIQASQECENVLFEFSRTSDWQPVFENPPRMMKLPPVSIEQLYSIPPNVEKLQSTLEERVKFKVQKWRLPMKTIWNRYCSGLLRDMLAHWEYWAFNPTNPRPVPGQRLKQLMVSYKMFGFPLNVPYTNAKSILKNIKSTGIHLNDEPNVEFGLAVEMYTYPNNVISVWVFLSSISRI